MFGLFNFFHDLGFGHGRDHKHHRVEIKPITDDDLSPSVEAPAVGMTSAYQWLGQVLFADQTDDAIYRLNDLNGDGDTADAGEQIIFFGPDNASGLATPTGSIFNVHQASNGTVYATDGDTDTVYRLRDLNKDGDADDVGESNVWFSEAENAAGLTLPTPNGIAEGGDGAIYVVNAGVASRPTDSIYRTEDLNGDGDANDEGEATVWLDLQAVNVSSSAFDLSFIGNVAYLTDTNGGTPDTVYRIEDVNGNGVIDAGEATVFISDTESYGAPIDIANAAQGESILTYTWIGNESDPPRIYRLTDLDGSGTIDDPAEAEEVWNWDHMPEGFAASVGFSIAASENGDIVFTINGGDPDQKNVVRLSDLNADGDYMDAGETVIALSNALDGDFSNRPRAVAFYSDGTTQDHPLTYHEGGPAVAFATDLKIVDPDSAMLSGATVRIVEGFDKRDDVLDVDLPTGSGIRASFDAREGVLTLAGAATAAEYEAILQTLCFESRTDDPSEALRHVTIAIYDERGLDGSSVEVATTIGVLADFSIETRFGTDKADWLRGSRDGERIVGLDGNDRIDAGRGDDIIDGGAGFDILTGGRGNDTFVFRGSSERDVITDFDIDDDLIVFEGVTLNGVAVASLEDAAAAARQIGYHAIEYNFDDGASLLLLNQHYDEAFI
jgi:Ca2+-binding RTX toxin-like protein